MRAALDAPRAFVVFALREPGARAFSDFRFCYRPYFFSQDIGFDAATLGALDAYDACYGLTARLLRAEPHGGGHPPPPAPTRTTASRARTSSCAAGTGFGRRPQVALRGLHYRAVHGAEGVTLPSPPWRVSATRPAPAAPSPRTWASARRSPSAPAAVATAVARARRRATAVDAPATAGSAPGSALQPATLRCAPHDGRGVDARVDYPPSASRSPPLQNCAHLNAAAGDAERGGVLMASRPSGRQLPTRDGPVLLSSDLRAITVSWLKAFRPARPSR